MIFTEYAAHAACVYFKFYLWCKSPKTNLPLFINLIKMAQQRNIPTLPTLVNSIEYVPKHAIAIEMRNQITIEKDKADI